MKIALLFLIIFQISSPPSDRGKQQEPATSKQNTTRNAPAQSIKAVSDDKKETSEQKNDTSAQSEKRPEKPPWWDAAWGTWALVVIGFFGTLAGVWTLLTIKRRTEAIESQVKEMRETGKQTDKLIAENIAQTQSLSQQADSLAKSAYHLGESANATYRSASAMEKIAEKIAASTEAATASVSAINKQMRAYLFVLVGSGRTVQNRANNVKFVASPILRNAGNTPAHKVSYKIKTGVLSVPLPGDFTFPLPNEAIEGSPLGAHQDATMNAFADDFYPDEEVESIKVCGNGKVLYVWGIVNYKDVFGESHSTKFCHTVNFVRIGTEDRIIGFYIGRQEEAD